MSGGFRGLITNHQTIKPQTFKPNSLDLDDTTDIMVCQTLKPHKKISQNQGEICQNRNVLFKKIYGFSRNQG
jgi:hypothetical protein